MLEHIASDTTIYSKYFRCFYCKQVVYTDRRVKSKKNNKCIPLDKNTGKPHECGLKKYYSKRSRYMLGAKLRS